MYKKVIRLCTLLLCISLSGCFEKNGINSEDNLKETNLVSTDEVAQEYTDEDLSYAFYNKGEKKDYMQYDNINYIIYGEYSRNANSNRGMVYDLKNKKCYYTHLYGKRLASIYTNEDDSIITIDLSDQQIDALMSIFNENKILEFPSEMNAKGNSKYEIKWSIGIIYEPGDFMSYSGSGDYKSKKYNIKAVREGILANYQ